jgi:uncharacterized repeat protein (TIGR03803 family)
MGMLAGAAGGLWPVIGWGAAAAAAPQDRVRFKELHSFAPADYPAGGLLQASDGYLYGVTRLGGRSGAGTVYRMDRSRKVKTVHAFNVADGEEPAARLMQASDGLIYGTTVWGGDFGRGTVFRINAAGAHELMHSFDGADGQYVLGSLIQASDGHLYGTTETIQSDVIRGKGSIFRLSLDGVFERLHVFKDVRNNGASPFCGLVQANDGHLYGTTAYGGEFDLGTAYRITLAGAFTLVHSFSWGDGAYPGAALIQASDGKLYGTTRSGGSDNGGTIFRMAPDGRLTTIYRFDKLGPVGGFPSGPLLEASDGNLYGSTGFNERSSPGTLFRLAPGRRVTPLYTFPERVACRDGLTETNNGALVGITGQGGGAFGGGSIFRLFDSRDPPSSVG